jgi:mRNA interferase MazF
VVAAADHSVAGWDVVRVDFPYADQAASRRRPALVLAAPQIGARFGIIWVLMITSARHQPWPGDVPIGDLRSAGLAHPCVVRTQKIATLDARLADRIGQLAAADRGGIVAALRGTLANALAQ